MRLRTTGSHVYDWMLRNFYTEHLIAIRKEMESGGGLMTLVNFLIELEKYSEAVLTLETVRGVVQGHRAG